jgi:ElaB/YqjD/DUF883 family membrane-anchored ribosome-binding protein
MSDTISKTRVMNKANDMKDSVRKSVRNGIGPLEQETSELGDSISRGATELAETVSTKLKAVGVDTQVMTELAKDQASELQRVIGEELKSHPMRALGIAAAVGVFVGLMTAR